MCPQANISEILLGGNGKGNIALETLIKQNDRPTIGGYFDHRLSQPDKIIGNEIKYQISVAQYSNHLPNNLYLIAGDPSLELQVQSVNQTASQYLPVNRWANVHKWILNLQSAIESKQGADITFFIDCNPSFATYTAQSLLAAKRLIIPCTADGSSARAIDNVGQLLYGVNVPQLYQKATFHYKVQENNLQYPLLHLIVCNRSTTNRQKPAQAFQAMYDKITEKVNNLDKKLFTGIENHIENMPDAHTVAIVASQLAMPVSQLTPRQYDLGGKKTTINKNPLHDYLKKLKDIVSLL